uniref:RNA methyltransferase n=1 Tax=Callorhinchus milii TaxID=7868 RepID=A0A4W3GB14_CALMI
PPHPPHPQTHLRGGAGGGVVVVARPRNGIQPLQQQQQRAYKRRNTFNVGFKHPGSKRRRRANSDCDPVLPSNFLLGGNIFDPLNLNSLLDEDVNKALNAETPKSSPLPSRNRDPVEILIPKDITDPLSLNSGNDSEVLPSPLKVVRKRRHRHYHHPAAPHPPTAAATAAPPQDCPAKENVSAGGEPQEGPQPYELNTVINCRDEIVSPVLRGAEAGGGPGSGSGSRHRKRRRTTSRSEAVKPGAGGATEEQQQRQKKFQYGNYSKYYGYRNPGRGEDPRLCVLKPHWFSGKDVLDLGCNSGHVTLSIAKHLKPSRIVGLDIDGALVHTARQNIRHFLSQDLLPPRGPGQAPRQFPLSLTKCKGPIAAPPVCLDASGPEFPNNVVFFQGNYVLETDELLDTQKPEYDVILCLSLTKWVHLNWGDEGLKRMFKRIYRHLRPGGIFLLEPQPWSSYGKRRKLTTIYRNYFKISLKPEQFTSFLLSSEVGFCSYELVGTPLSTSKGFQRPVYLFHKSRPSSSSN